MGARADTQTNLKVVARAANPDRTARPTPDHGYLNARHDGLPELPLRRWGREDFVFKKPAPDCRPRLVR